MLSCGMSCNSSGWAHESCPAIGNMRPCGVHTYYYVQLVGEEKGQSELEVSVPRSRCGSVEVVAVCGGVTGGLGEGTEIPMFLDIYVWCVWRSRKERSFAVFWEDGDVG